VHEAIWNVSFIVGPGLGGVLIAWVGAIDALWITAVGFATTAVLTALIRLPGTAAPNRDQQGEGMWADTVAGLRFVWHDRLLLAVTAMSAALISIYMPIEGVLLPVHFEALDQPGRLGGIVMAMSIGGIVGALAYSAWGARFRRSLIFRLALLGTAAFIVVLALLPAFPVMLVASFAIGLAYGPVGPVVNLAMQSRSPGHMRGRVVGIITSTEYAAGPVGYLLVGAATQRWGVKPTFVTVAVTLVVVAVVGLFVRGLGELDGLEAPTDHDGDRPLSSVIDEATRGPVPLVRPPRDPEQLIR
jgi:predicted MFS family arabinose efflux permease